MITDYNNVKVISFFGRHQGDIVVERCFFSVSHKPANETTTKIRQKKTAPPSCFKVKRINDTSFSDSRTDGHLLLGLKDIDTDSTVAKSMLQDGMVQRFLRDGSPSWFHCCKINTSSPLHVGDGRRQSSSMVVILPGFGLSFDCSSFIYQVVYQVIDYHPNT